MDALSYVFGGFVGGLLQTGQYGIELLTPAATINTDHDIFVVVVQGPVVAGPGPEKSTNQTYYNVTIEYKTVWGVPGSNLTFVNHVAGIDGNGGTNKVVVSIKNRQITGATNASLFSLAYLYNI